jgi:Phage integrase, N-terminal SAM-like domain
VTFAQYVEEIWWPSRHLEVTTKAGYRSYLDRHFVPYFGDMPLADILPSTVQAWVTHAAAAGLSARSITKYHGMLKSIFKRAVRDRVIGYNPCSDTELPKVISRKSRTLTPEEFQTLLAHILDRFLAMVLAVNRSPGPNSELGADRPGTPPNHSRTRLTPHDDSSSQTVQRATSSPTECRHSAWPPNAQEASWYLHHPRGRDPRGLYN